MVMLGETVTRRPVNWQVPGVVTNVTDDEGHVGRKLPWPSSAAWGQAAAEARSSRSVHRRRTTGPFLQNLGPSCLIFTLPDSSWSRVNDDGAVSAIVAMWNWMRPDLRTEDRCRGPAYRITPRPPTTLSSRRVR
jgi:hypothetical protein